MSDNQPVLVYANQGLWDSITASLRLLAIIASTAPAAVLVFQKHDLIAIYDFFHTQQGAAMLSALGGLTAIVFGVLKSLKRGRQVAKVAASPAVPPSVADIKK